MTLAIRLWFYLAVAILGVVVADPLIEFCSNTGLFGPRNFTDRSNWVIVPALILGVLFIALHFYLRIGKIFVDAKRRRTNWIELTSKSFRAHLLRLIPVMLALQIVALYLMETLEQIVVYGHVFGGTIWLGGPAIVALPVHVAACCVVTLSVAWVLQFFDRVTEHFVRAFTTLCAGNADLVYLPGWDFTPNHRSLRVLCRIGERAPPFIAA